MFYLLACFHNFDGCQGSKVHHKIKKGISEAKSSTDEGAQPGDTGFTAAAIAAAKRQSGEFNE